MRIARPGRDFKVNPIEEVTMRVEADDDFGLQNGAALLGQRRAGEDASRC